MKLLELVYRGILTGMPLLTYNPITKNTLNVPMIVNPESTYLNFKLDNEKVKKLEKYIKKYSNLSMIPIKMDEKEEYILSVNVYNCTSPVFLNDKEITRFEINTYVRDEYNNNGTLILDYISNELSMDPLNIIKWKQDLVYNKYDVFLTSPTVWNKLYKRSFLQKIQIFELKKLLVIMETQKKL